jgi:DDE_Tnp_1-associated
MAARMNRRFFSMLSKRLDELGLNEIDDARDDRGKRWRLGTLLRATLGAMVAGAKSLAKVEELSERLSQPTRRLLGVQRRLPDTTLRNALCTIEPDQVKKPLHCLVRKAHRRKALEPNELPFGVVSLDGPVADAHDRSICRPDHHHGARVARPKTTSPSLNPHPIPQG